MGSIELFVHDTYFFVDWPAVFIAVAVLLCLVVVLVWMLSRK